MASLDTSGPRGGLRLGRLGAGGDSGWSRTRAGFALGLGGLARASEYLSKIGSHYARAVGWGSRAVVRSNSGIQGEADMSDAEVFY